jgi:anthranilate synthase/aminodeoxychorismate synthase-like glutamine amidotransferase
MIYVIDNYDSFVYNLIQYLGADGYQVIVRRNDEVTVSGVRAARPDLVLISPGPGRPEGAGICPELIRDLSGVIPLFGVCLGHQAIGAAFGARVVQAARPMHGKLSTVHHDGQGVFTGIPNPIQAVRYHSLAVDRASLPACLQVTAVAEDNEVMGLRHIGLPIESVQFHPESIFTEHGPRIVANAARLRGINRDCSTPPNGAHIRRQRADHDGPTRIEGAAFHAHDGVFGVERAGLGTLLRGSRELSLG